MYLLFCVQVGPVRRCILQQPIKLLFKKLPRTAMSDDKAATANAARPGSTTHLQAPRGVLSQRPDAAGNVPAAQKSTLAVRQHNPYVAEPTAGQSDQPKTFLMVPDSGAGPRVSLPVPPPEKPLSSSSPGTSLNVETRVAVVEFAGRHQHFQLVGNDVSDKDIGQIVVVDGEGIDAREEDAGRLCDIFRQSPPLPQRRVKRLATKEDSKRTGDMQPTAEEQVVILHELLAARVPMWGVPTIEFQFDRKKLYVKLPVLQMVAAIGRQLFDLLGSRIRAALQRKLHLQCRVRVDYELVGWPA